MGGKPPRPAATETPNCALTACPSKRKNTKRKCFRTDTTHTGRRPPNLVGGPPGLPPAPWDGQASLRGEASAGAPATGCGSPTGAEAWHSPGPSAAARPALQGGRGVGGQESPGAVGRVPTS